MTDAGRADLWRGSFVMIMILPAGVRSEEDGEIPMRQKKAVFCCYSHRMIYLYFYLLAISFRSTRWVFVFLKAIANSGGKERRMDGKA